MNFLREVHNQLTERQQFNETVEANAKHVGFETPVLICERAADVLSSVAQKIEHGSELSDDEFNQIVDLVTGLYVVSDEDMREATGLSDKSLGIIAQFAGEEKRVDNRLKSIADHESFKSIREKVKNELTSAAQGGEDASETLNKLKKMRLNYEQLANQYKHEQGQ